MEAEQSKSDEELLPESEQKNAKGIVQSSVSQEEYREKHITISKNGLIWAAYQAYCEHLHLTLRSEDVWLAIISQIGFYIKAHAEELRSMFVNHEGRQDLVAPTYGSIDTMNFAKIAQDFANMVQKKVKTPDLQAWITPSFSTTTETDRAVASILMMGSMQAYFSFSGRSIV